MPNRSIFQKLIGDTKVGKWLYGDNTYTDGYGTVRKDTNLSESTQGQELKRMNETAKNAGKIALTGFSLMNPVTASTTLAGLAATLGQAYGLSLGAKNVYDTTKKAISNPSSVSTPEYIFAGMDAIPFLSGFKNGLNFTVKKGLDYLNKIDNNNAAKWRELNKIFSQDPVKLSDPLPDDVLSIILDDTGKLKSSRKAGVENRVFVDKVNDRVIKVSNATQPETALRFAKWMSDKSKIGEVSTPTKIIGGYSDINGMRVVSTQPIVKTWDNWGDLAQPIINRKLKQAGYKKLGIGIYESPEGVIFRDVKASNVGTLNGKFVVHDPELIK